MQLQRYYLECLSHASYLIADEATGTAAVVDPQRDIQLYLDEAERLGVEIKYVLLTHFHADFVAGHIELRDRVGAKIYLGEAAQAEYDYVPLKDGDVLEFGKVRLSVLHTPGHTPEGISILVYDLAKDDRNPYAVLTGDTLFIGDVGRPDLLASIGVTADQLADMLYDSLHNKLMTLPDATLVYPAHGAGSMCGKQLSDAAVSTIGEQKKYNYALQPMDRVAFKQIVLADQPDAPDYFAHDVTMNRQDRSSLEDSMRRSLKPLTLQDVVKLQQQGAQVLDVRAPIDFSGSHLKGSLNVGLDGKYATWCGSVLDKSTPIVVVAEAGREEEAILRLGRIGFDHVEGYLEGGPWTLNDHPELVAKVDRMTAQDLDEQLAQRNDLPIVDVRNPAEYAAGHIPGSVNIPLNQLAKRLSEVPRGDEVVVNCQGGYRSSIAVSLLQANGFEGLIDLVGGYAAWAALQKTNAQQTAQVSGR